MAETMTNARSAQWGRDAMSPPFHLNLQYGLRYLHAVVLLLLDQKYGVSARAIPVYFQKVPAVKKPGKLAIQEDKEAYKKERKKNNLSVKTVEMLKEMRKENR